MSHNIVNESEFRICGFEDEEIEKALDLVHHEYGDIELGDRGFFSWQAFGNPAGNAIITTSKKEADERIFGLYEVSPIRVQVENQEILGSIAINLVVHPDARRQGLFTRLAERAYQFCPERGIAFTYGFPNPAALPGHTKRLNSPDIGEVPLLLKAIDVRSILRGRGLGPILSSMGTALYKLFLLGKVPFSRRNRFFSSDIEIQEISKFDSKFDDFWRSVKSRYPIWVVRDSSFLNWRYREIPIRKYEVFAAFARGEMQAYLVTRIMDFQGMRCGMLVDFVIGQYEQSRACGLQLIQHALKLFENESVQLAGCLVQPHADEYELLKLAGFIKCPKRFLPQSFPVIMRVHENHKQLASVYEMRKWFFTMGDYDVI